MRQRSKFDLIRRQDRAAQVRREFDRLSRKWPGQPLTLMVTAHEGEQEADDFVHLLGNRGEEYLLKLIAGLAAKKLGAMKVTELVGEAIADNRRRVLQPGAEA